MAKSRQEAVRVIVSKMQMEKGKVLVENDQVKAVMEKVHGQTAE